MFVLFVWRSPWLEIICAGWRTFTLHKGNDRITQCDSVYFVYGRAPTRQLHSVPIAVSGSGYNGKKINSFDAVTHVQENPPQKRILAGRSSSFIRLAEHFTALRAWVQAMSVWSVKTRRAPSLHLAEILGHKPSLCFHVKAPRYPVRT